MAATFQNVSKVKLNDARLAAPPFSVGVQIGLILNSWVGPYGDPTVGNAVLASEAAFGGYARQNVSGWAGSVLTGDGHAKASASVALFNNTSGAPQTLGGFFLIDTTSANVVLIGAFAAPIVIPDGDTLPLVPFWTTTNE